MPTFDAVHELNVLRALPPEKQLAIMQHFGDADRLEVMGLMKPQEVRDYVAAQDRHSNFDWEMSKRQAVSNMSFVRTVSGGGQDTDWVQAFSMSPFNGERRQRIADGIRNFAHAVSDAQTDHVAQQLNTLRALPPEKQLAIMQKMDVNDRFEVMGLMKPQEVRNLVIAQDKIGGINWAATKSDRGVSHGLVGMLSFGYADPDAIDGALAAPLDTQRRERITNGLRNLDLAIKDSKAYFTGEVAGGGVGLVAGGEVVDTFLGAAKGIGWVARAIEGLRASKPVSAVMDSRAARVLADNPATRTVAAWSLPSATRTERVAAFLAKGTAHLTKVGLQEYALMKISPQGHADQISDEAPSLQEHLANRSRFTLEPNATDHQKSITRADIIQIASQNWRHDYQVAHGLRPDADDKTLDAQFNALSQNQQAAVQKVYEALTINVAPSANGTQANQQINAMNAAISGAAQDVTIPPAAPAPAAPSARTPGGTQGRLHDLRVSHTDALPPPAPAAHVPPPQTRVQPPPRHHSTPGLDG